MSFENPIVNNNFTKCWERKYQWKGGTKDVTLEDGQVAQMVKGNWESYNPETKKNEMFPPDMKICVIGVTTCIGGYFYDERNPANNCRFYSNEVLNTFDQPLKVFKKTATGTEKLYEDLYQTFKENKPQGMQLQVNLYFYNFDDKKVYRMELLGSARNEWFGSKLNGKNLYEHWLKISEGEHKKTGSTNYCVPKYEYGDAYTSAERDEVIGSDAYKAYAQYEKRLLDGSIDDIDQTPAQYEDEQSQDTPEEDAPINLEDVPF